MRVLLDTCVWGGAVKDLRSAGHDALWAGDWEQDPGDEEILARAHDENRVLVTLDKDFGELAVVKRTPHSRDYKAGQLSREEAGTYCIADPESLWRGFVFRSDHHGGFLSSISS